MYVVCACIRGMHTHVLCVYVTCIDMCGMDMYMWYDYAYMVYSVHMHVWYVNVHICVLCIYIFFILLFIYFNFFYIEV